MGNERTIIRIREQAEQDGTFSAAVSFDHGPEYPYQHTLQIYIEFNDRYEQAHTYNNLGLLAQDQQQWKQARNYLLQALEIYAEYKDEYSVRRTLRNIARLWRESSDANILAMVAERLGMEVSEVEKLLREMLGEGDDEKTQDGEG